ncbi:peptidyl-prolyl cis-trans isomerase [Jeongeupia chitinilytica]|uniref:Peptidyl-prolyl cis-trans isomerase n=2 Tax=Jeongeupia chitinilytica TaxID=1041641 RepID=A0ABQ3H1G3_9NEIS|nr:peptidylprolyl isomerase [Jeongeupia chitinilytica]GHD65691.1 peptidyl-prolyl cis-trans isomerase [Jeongeupia chitinilytica]
MKKIFAAAALSLAAMSAFAANPQVELVTNKGKIVLELYPDKAPATVANFLQYVKDKHYDGTVFHRVVADFVVQGGGFDVKGNQKPTRAPVKNEAQAAFKAGLKNDRGTLAMARTSDPNSASSQFYVNLKNNDFLNWPGRDGAGYAVFGKVVAGMDVVDKIGAVKTLPGDTPVDAVVVESARELPAGAAAKQS